MAFCKNCGSHMEDTAVVCPQCGTAQTTTPAVVDDGGFLWGALGCCVPLAGLIMFLLWKDSKPKTAKTAGIGALVGVGVNVVLTVLMTIIGAIAGAM